MVSPVAGFSQPVAEEIQNPRPQSPKQNGPERVEQVHVQDGQGMLNSSSLSGVIARVMIAARYLLAGNFNIESTISDMAQIEKSVKKLAQKLERCAEAVNSAKDAVIQFAQSLPSVAEAAANATQAFMRTFPFLRKVAI